MNKFILLTSVLLISGSAMALTCDYTAEQEIVRSAENLNEIRELPAGLDMNAEYNCGGSLLQLAVLRGNPDTLQYLVENGADVTKPVSLKGYEIPGAPDTVPFVMFVARYSPSSAIVDYLLDTEKVNFQVLDANKHDVFWYFEQNPVLRKSYLTKQGFAGLMPLSERIKMAREQIMAESEEAAAAQSAE